MLNVLITGANRGVGLELSKLYLARGDRVIAAVRDPSTVNPTERLLIVKLDSTSVTDASSVVDELQASHGITKIDLVIASAAISPSHAKFKDVRPQDLELAWRTNTQGPLLLFQAVLPLLDEATSKFVVLTTTVGSFSTFYPTVGQDAYGQSKVALNFMVDRLNREFEKLVIFGLNPGWIDTDMGNQGAGWAGFDAPPQKLSETAPAMIEVIDKATKINYSGRAVDYTGAIQDW